MAAFLNAAESLKLKDILQLLISAAGIGIAIYVPWRQNHNRRLEDKRTRKARAVNTVSMLSGDVIVLYAQISYVLQGVEQGKFSSPAMPGQQDRLRGMKLAIPAHLWTLANALVDSEEEITKSLVLFIKAAEQYNGLLDIQIANAENGLRAEHYHAALQTMVEGLKKRGRIRTPGVGRIFARP